MNSKSFTLQFDGYWREINAKGLPACAGNYCVYACEYNNKFNEVSLRDLLYIGESKDVQSRVLNQKKMNGWKSELHPDPQIKSCRK